MAANGLSPADAGSYQVVVSNTFGLATSVVAQVVIHCVDAAGQAPTPPYLSWAAAATNIQDAIDATAAGDFVLVTNGVYASGGKVMSGDLTNRVALDKPVVVTSVNGYGSTVIQGSSGTPTNGPSGVRCAWMTLTGSPMLNGFTLRGGATRTSGDTSGGGVMSFSTNSIVSNCLIVGNTANQGGGGYQGTFNNCLILSNSATAGGGAYWAALNNCLLSWNSSSPASGSGGAYSSYLVNCTVTGNVNYGVNGQIAPNSCVNCILYFNSGANYIGGFYNYCCTTPQPGSGGFGNIISDPQLMEDGIHLASTSPCRGAGTNRFVTGVDIDGKAWANPPSIGCDDWQPVPLIITQPKAQFVGSPSGIVFSTTTAAGQAPFAYFWSKDGTLLDDGGKYNGAHTPALVVGGLALSDAGAYQVVVSKPIWHGH